ncbi:DUF2127 domain-containing protein [Diaminobutyricibacter sp. McL0618]|uniref:DUF2127 domain-containing protein n=1 Tax=Leifsonia sp. McL0618 TaxID=3415677 RepID=UPI003CE6B077
MTERSTVANGTVPRKITLLDRFYFVGVAIKGIDGAIELIAGLILLFAPSLLHSAVEAVADRASQGDSTLARFLGTYLENLDDSLLSSGLTVLILFLILHGVIKLGLVYCLLRRIRRAYPPALIVLTLFLVYQLYLFVLTPTVSLGLFALLDVVIIVLVYREYRELQRDARSVAATEV